MYKKHIHILYVLEKDIHFNIFAGAGRFDVFLQLIYFAKRRLHTLYTRACASMRV